MALFVDPLDSLQKDDVTIIASGLRKGENYEIRLFLDHFLGIYGSYAVFKADEHGFIYLRRDSPIRGSYSGVRPMGLFESIQPLDDVRYGNYCKVAPAGTWNYRLQLLDNVGNAIDMKRFSKQWVAEDVERIVVREQRIRGVLFKPKGDGPFPTVLDISGTGGGLNEQRAAALSAEGFCVLALAFFQYEDLPSDLADVGIEYFGEAIDWLCNQSFTNNFLALQGISFGAAVVFRLASYSSKVKAVIFINGPYCFTDNAYLNMDGEPMPFARPVVEEFYHINHHMCYDRPQEFMELTEEAEFPLPPREQNVAFRFVVSLDDRTTPIFKFATNLACRVREAGGIAEVDCGPGGHLMEPPYFPHHAGVYSKFIGMNQAYGGETSLHGESQVRLWRNSVEFLRKHLGQYQDYNCSAVVQSKL